MPETDCLRCPSCGGAEIELIDESIHGNKYRQDRKCRKCKHIVAFNFKIFEIKIKEMKAIDEQYLFVTDQGIAIAPDGETVENLQMLGIAPGTTAKNAFKSLLKDEPWIKKRGYTEAAAYRLDPGKIDNVNMIEV